MSTCAIWAPGFVVFTKWVIPPLPYNVALFIYICVNINSQSNCCIHENTSYPTVFMPKWQLILHTPFNLTLDIIDLKKIE